VTETTAPVTPEREQEWRQQIAEAISHGMSGGGEPVSTRTASVQDATAAVLPVVRAAVAAETERARTLTETDRAFLAFALDLAADHMASRSDEFDESDDAAMTKLRHMAAAPATGRCTCEPDGANRGYHDPAPTHILRRTMTEQPTATPPTLRDQITTAIYQAIERGGDPSEAVLSIVGPALDSSAWEQYDQVESERAQMPADERRAREAADASLLRIQVLHLLKRAQDAEERERWLRERLRLVTDEKVAYVTGPTTELLCGEIARLKAEVAAARGFAAEMRGFCSPHGVAVGYADRLTAAMDRAKEGR